MISSYAQIKVGDEIKGKLKEVHIITKVIDVSNEIKISAVILTLLLISCANNKQQFVINNVISH